MKNTTKFIITLCAVLTVMLGVGYLTLALTGCEAPTVQDYSGKLKAKEKELAQKDKELANLELYYKKEIASKKQAIAMLSIINSKAGSDIVGLRGNIQALDEANTKANSDIVGLRDDIQALEDSQSSDADTIAENKRKIAEKEQQITEKEDEIKERVKVIETKEREITELNQKIALQNKEIAVLEVDHASAIADLNSLTKKINHPDYTMRNTGQSLYNDARNEWNSKNYAKSRPLYARALNFHEFLLTEDIIKNNKSENARVHYRMAKMYLERSSDQTGVARNDDITKARENMRRTLTLDEDGYEVLIKDLENMHGVNLERAAASPARVASDGIAGDNVQRRAKQNWFNAKRRSKNASVQQKYDDAIALYNKKQYNDAIAAYQRLLNDFITDNTANENKSMIGYIQYLLAKIKLEQHADDPSTADVNDLISRVNGHLAWAKKYNPDLEKRFINNLKAGKIYTDLQAKQK